MFQLSALYRRTDLQPGNRYCGVYIDSDKMNNIVSIYTLLKWT